MFHIIANLELMFDNLDAALAWAESRPVFYPRIPSTAMDEEDKITPRICVAPCIADCITAVGVVGQFRRCLNANESAKSYENDDEAYPVFIVKFANGLNYIKPSKKQVPDIKATNEHWLTHPAQPKSIELKWLDAYSIKIRDSETDIRTKCTKVHFLKDISGYHHPWLDGKGHPLDSSDMGDDPWPDVHNLASQLYYDGIYNGVLGFITPVWPLNGQYIFNPIKGAIKPYRTFLHRLQRFTGVYDEEFRPVFQRQFVQYMNGIDRLTGTVEWFEDGRYGFLPANRNEPVYLSQGDKQHIIQGLRILTPLNISIPDEFRPPKH